MNSLLPLVRNPDILSAQLNTTHGLFGGNRTFLTLILDECNTASAGHRTQLLKARKAREDGCEGVLSIILG